MCHRLGCKKLTAIRTAPVSGSYKDNLNTEITNLARSHLAIMLKCNITASRRRRYLKLIKFHQRAQSGRKDPWTDGLVTMVYRRVMELCNPSPIDGVTATLALNLHGVTDYIRTCLRTGQVTRHTTDGFGALVADADISSTYKSPEEM